MEHVITFHDDGTAGAIYADEIAPILRGLGPCETRRASHVEPAFDGTSWIVTYESWVPSNGQVRGPYPTRAEALAAEAAELGRVL